MPVEQKVVKPSKPPSAPVSKEKVKV